MSLRISSELILQRSLKEKPISLFWGILPLVAFSCKRVSGRGRPSRKKPQAKNLPENVERLQKYFLPSLGANFILFT